MFDRYQRVYVRVYMREIYRKDRDNRHLMFTRRFRTVNRLLLNIVSRNSRFDRLVTLSKQVDIQGEEIKIQIIFSALCQSTVNIN